MMYFLHVLSSFALAALQVAGLSLVVGLAGVLALNAGLMVAVGAYTYALTVGPLESSTLAFLLALVAGSAAGGLCGLLALRLSGDALVLGTLAAQLVGTTLIANLDNVTGGSYGIAAIRRPEWGGGPATNMHMALVILTVTVAVLGVVYRWYHSPLARVFRGSRDMPADFVLLGRSLAHTRWIAFACTGAVLGIAGGLSAAFATFIDPSTGDLGVSISLLAAVIIGGAGRLRGAIAGAAIITLIPEGLRFVDGADLIAPALQQLLYGTLLVACIWFKPAGLLGDFSFRARGDAR